MARDAETTGRAAGGSRKETDQRIADSMSARYDLPPQDATRRFLIVAEPRSGGSLVAEALRLCGHAGVPFEYLNPRLMRAYGQRLGRVGDVPFEEYFDFLLRHRTTPNGVFAIKALVDHVAAFLKRGPQAEALMRSFDRYVILRRRDKLAQAVSYFRATTSDVWNSLDGSGQSGDDADMPFRPMEISQILRGLFSFERSLGVIARRAERQGKPVAMFEYESIDADFPATWTRLLSFLDLPATPLEKISTTLERQRDAVSDRLIERYLAVLRDSGAREPVALGEYDGGVA